MYCEIKCVNHLKMCYHRQICIVLLVGIPGSGKSFFRVFFEDYIKANNKSVLGCAQICSVCYDNYSSVKNPSLLCEGSKWKNERIQIIKDVQNICLLLKDNDKNISELYSNVTLVNGDVDKPDCILLLIDDNMYYKSMRYEYFKLAKACNFSFCQLFFYISLDKALLCNRNRHLDSQLPDTIIKRMFSKIEPPQPSRNLWEVNTLSISSYADFQDKNILHSIITCIYGALTNPLKSIDIHSVKEEAQQITNSNVLHQIDNILKQLVGLCIKHKLKENSENPNLISAYLSNKRQNIFKEIKERTIILPIDLNSPINSEKIEMIKPILLNLLQN